MDLMPYESSRLEILKRYTSYETYKWKFDIFGDFFGFHEITFFFFFNNSVILGPLRSFIFSPLIYINNSLFRNGMLYIEHPTCWDLANVPYMGFWLRPERVNLY